MLGYVIYTRFLFLDCKLFPLIRVAGLCTLPLVLTVMYVLHQIYVGGMYTLHQISVSALYAFCVPYPRLIFLGCTYYTRSTLAGCLLYTRFLFLHCMLFPLIYITGPYARLATKKKNNKKTTVASVVNHKFTGIKSEG